MEILNLIYLVPVVISRIFYPMTLRVLIHSHPFKRSKHSIVSTKQKASNSNNHVAGISSNLSSVLEKLYLWEKKLFKEVKVWTPVQENICFLFIHVCSFLYQLLHHFMYVLVC